MATYRFEVAGNYKPYPAENWMRNQYFRYRLLRAFARLSPQYTIISKIEEDERCYFLCSGALDYSYRIYDIQQRFQRAVDKYVAGWSVFTGDYNFTKEK